MKKLGILVLSVLLSVFSLSLYAASQREETNMAFVEVVEKNGASKKTQDIMKKELAKAVLTPAQEKQLADLRRDLANKLADLAAAPKFDEAAYRKVSEEMRNTYVKEAQDYEAVLVGAFKQLDQKEREIVSKSIKDLYTIIMARRNR